MIDGLRQGAPVAALLVTTGCLLAVSGAHHVAVALASLLLLLTLGPRPLVVGLVAATFVTRFRLELGGANFLVEHVVLAVCAVALVVHGRGAALVSVARDRTLVLLGAFVAWNGVASAVQAVEPGQSLLIVGWLALDWLMVVVLAGSTDEPGLLVRPALVSCGVAAGLAIAMWASAHLLGTGFGISAESVTGAPSLHGLSHEPNILAATLALWLFVAFTSPRYRQSRRSGVFVAVCALGVVLTLTRAAVVGLVGGVVVWALVRGRSARRAAARAAAGFALVLAVLWLAAPGIAAPIVEKGSQLLNFGSQTGQVRLDQWRQALDDLEGTDWLIGLGSNSFGQRHLEPTLPESPTPAYLGNLPLQVLYDSGVVGLVLLGATLVSVLTWARLREGRAAGLLTVYVLCAAATSPFWFGTTWLLLAVALVDRRRISAEPGTAVPPAAASAPVGRVAVTGAA